MTIFLTEFKMRPSLQQVLNLIGLHHNFPSVIARYLFSYSFLRYRFLGYWLWRTKCSWSLRQSISLRNMDSRSAVEKKLKILNCISPKCPPVTEDGFKISCYKEIEDLELNLPFLKNLANIVSNYIL